MCSEHSVDLSQNSKSANFQSQEDADVAELVEEERLTDILREKQAIAQNFEYCQERAALLRDTLDVWSRSGVVLSIFDREIFLYIRRICDDILSADEPVIPF